jgi:hypothetical protein
MKHKTVTQMNMTEYELYSTREEPYRIYNRNHNENTGGK